MSNLTVLIDALVAEKQSEKPTVKALAELAGIKKVNADERDEAWDEYQLLFDDPPKPVGPADNELGDSPAVVKIQTTGIKSFRRAGFGFGQHPTIIPRVELTPGQLTALQSEVNLKVVIGRLDNGEFVTR